MAKDYGVVFGSNPQDNTGLSPTFIVFAEAASGQTLTPPGVSETIVGSGFYHFQYTPTLSIYFEIDGGSSLADSDRYAAGILDPIQLVDQRVGTVDDSIGSTSADPTSALGYLKRNLEFLEGNAEFTKSSGVWQIFSRGSSTLLRVKTLTNTNTEASKE